MSMVSKFYDISRFVIWGDEINEESRKSRLIISFKNGNPRFTVYTGIKGPGSIIQFPCDAVHMVTIAVLLKEVADSEPGEKIAVTSKTTKYVDDRPTKELELVSTLYIGKSKDGIVYFSIISENKPKLIFTLKPSRFHTFLNGEGVQIPDSEISKKMAKAIGESIANLVTIGIMQYTSEENLNSKSGTDNTSQNQSLNIKQGEFEDIDFL